MVLYSLEAVNALLSPIQKIQGRPTFSSLWHLAQAFYDALRKLDHADQLTNAWAGYLMTKEEFALRSTTSWTGPEIVGKYLVMPTGAIISGDQEQAKGEYKSKKEISDSYDVILMAIKSTFERVIDKVYHTTGNTSIMGDGFGQLTSFDILQCLHKKYGRANIEDIGAKLLHLNNPIYRNLPVEVLIQDIEDVQQFLLANPADNIELTDVQICNHGLIKLSKTGGLYENATERWNLKDRTIHQQWMKFKTRFIAEYKKMLATNGGTTMGQKGYGTSGAYSATYDNGSSLAESIAHYAGRATQAEGKVNELESRLAALEIGPPPTQTQTGYYAPQMAYGMIPGEHPPPASIQIPPSYQQPQQHSNGGKRDNNENNRGGQRSLPNNYQGGGRGGGYRGDRHNANNTKRHTPMP